MAEKTPGPGRFYSQACASVFGGPGDPGTGHQGYKGDNLQGTKAFAELMMGTALGNLPYRAKVAVSYKGKYVICEKLDIGAGGPGCGGFPRKIDLWYEVAQELGFSGLGVVTYQIAVTPQEAKKLEKEYPKGMGANVQGAAEEGVNAVKSAVGYAADLGKILSFLSSSSGWLRVGKVVLGGVLLIVAVDELTKIGPTASTNLKSGAKSSVGKVSRAAVTKNPLELL